MNKNTHIYIAGHKGMVGSAILRLLQKEGYKNLLTKTHQELDLMDFNQVSQFFQKEKLEVVILAAAKVGGIQANIDDPAGLLYENLVIQNNVIHQAYLNQVQKLVFLGSSCIYPKECPQPMKEEYLLTGLLEPTNEGYALAKIAGLKLAQYYEREYGILCLNLIPCNLYGQNDNFDLEKSHVLAALIRKFVDTVDEEKPEIVLWGSGVARREFMNVDDLAKALLFLIEKYNSPDIINIGSGIDMSIKELAEMIARKVGYKGTINWDIGKPNGMLRKCLDTSKLNSLGFSPTISLDTGISQMIKNYRQLKKEGSAK